MAFYREDGLFHTSVWLFTEALPVTLGLTVTSPYSGFIHSRVNELIFIGPQITRTGAFVLRLLGFGCSLSMREDHDDHENRCALPVHFNPARIYTSFQDHLYYGALFIRETIAKNKKIYIHCKHGRHRAPSAVIACFLLQGIPFEEAVSKVRKFDARSEHGPYFLKELKKFHQQLSDRGFSGNL